jgi:hypothetical protein
MAATTFTESEVDGNNTQRGRYYANQDTDRKSVFVILY